jgi:alpha-galactosidase
MTKIALIGAGSVVFTKNLLTDILSFPELHGSTIAVHDINPERLETAGMMARWTSEQLGANAKVEECPHRRAALDGADFVVNTVLIGMYEAALKDFDIPRKYGIKQTIADTLGIGGIFRALRTIPFVLQLGEDMRACCPGGRLLNYTNPMSMLIWAFYETFPDIPVVGLCHSVQHTSRQLASYIGVPSEDLVFDCAGINHHAWMTRLEVDGQDVYPRLFEAMEDPATYAKDKVRFELMRRFGAFVTESSMHNAEYVPYFLKDARLIEEFDIPVDEYVRRSKLKLESFTETRRKLLAGESFPLERSVEYASLIIHSVVTKQPRVIYGNVRNDHLIDNLPLGCCVEVPVLVDGAGFTPCHFGSLPPQLAASCAANVAVQELTVRAALDGDRAHVAHAAMLDRHAASVLSLAQIQSMTDELIEAHRDLLPAGIAGA